MNRTEKPKKSSAELVELMKEKGICFNIQNETYAADYLNRVNNYLRTVSYAVNFEKYTMGPRKGRYMHLEFAYLTELASIDRELRMIIMRLCLDIEHELKSRLTKAVERNPLEDGYDIVDRYFRQYPGELREVESKADSLFVGPLIEQYFTLRIEEPVDDADRAPSGTDTARRKIKIEAADCPAWVYIELLSIGDLCKFIEFYNSVYETSCPEAVMPMPSRAVLSQLRTLRNACAHDNCIMTDLRRGSTRPTEEITRFVAAIPGIGKEERKHKLSARPVYDIVCLLKIYTDIVTDETGRAGLSELKASASRALSRHSDYFSKNLLITSTFNFLKKTLDNFG